MDQAEMAKNIDNAIAECRKEGYDCTKETCTYVKCPKLKEMKKSELTCDKSKEPPCHLEPSTELCQKCPLNVTPNK